MWRKALFDLTQWLEDENRKPLILRGARQVGKTWLIRELAKISNRNLLELNLEKTPQLASLFINNDPLASFKNISQAFNLNIQPEQAILFIDEVQAVPEILAKLRWFYEELPELPVVTAGSLLEFVLDEHDWSMPVGRVSYYHLEPLSFSEFLHARDQSGLFEFVNNYQWNEIIPQYTHENLMQFINEYILIGGMPAAVSTWCQVLDTSRVNIIHQDLIGSYRDDFGKYAGRVPHARLQDVLMTIPQMLGQKFQYSKANPDVQAIALRKALELLNKARVCHSVHSTTAEGLPLRAGKKDKVFKVIYADIGLALSALGYELPAVIHKNSINLANKGGLAEQLVGQMLRTTFPYYIEPELFYWNRDKTGAAAEIDYLGTMNNQVMPIEVKAGTTGSLRSLHYFMAEKKLPVAMRFNSDLPSTVDVDMKTTQGKPAKYTLFSLPFYLCEQIRRIEF